MSLKQNKAERNSVQVQKEDVAGGSHPKPKQKAMNSGIRKSNQTKRINHLRVHDFEPSSVGELSCALEESLCNFPSQRAAVPVWDPHGSVAREGLENSLIVHPSEARSMF
jgi:hypothetical protein